MAFPAPTHTRVTANTSPAVNRWIERRTRTRIQRAHAGGIGAIDQRLAQLDREWDIERCLEAGASSLMLTGVLLGAAHNRRWLLLSLGVGGFLLQHALQGWCPPLPVLRRFGVRTAEEINRERYALKALRGDFADVSAAEPRGQAVVAYRGALR
ncbi:conserved hypothetical protein [Ricinus communis]|uniref:DUF2892 domain-containing protein n=1 Tax=Ricinus communis TaxID=3988 RepID=B9TFZ4_RICCO|nr:conserved hypothetical protein [Ricinus communis]